MGRTTHRLTCEDLHRLDINEFRRDGLLEGSGTVTWSRGNRVTGSVFVQGHGHGVRLSYTSGDGAIDETVRLTRTPCHFGGVRIWFSCPGCGRRVAILYGGRHFRCRKCHDLRYESQRSNRMFKVISKLQKIRRKLRASPDISRPFPDRPRYMHRRTYTQLKGEDRTLMRNLESCVHSFGQSIRKKAH